MSSVLIVGGGIAGSTLAILLCKAGVDVSIAEIRPNWNAWASASSRACASRCRSKAWK